MADAAEGWVPEGASTLHRMVAGGLLTEQEALEVELTIEMVVRLVAHGDISQHFGDWIVQRLATEKEEARHQRRLEKEKKP